VLDGFSERLQESLSGLRSSGKLTEEDVNKGMRQVRLALLEADVNFKVVKQFTAKVKERCLESDVLESLNPGQQVLKVVNDELTTLMGGSSHELSPTVGSPTVILLAGLQGSGKTTTAAKLAKYLQDSMGLTVGIAACDVYRPAAIDQLVTVGTQVGAEVYQQGTDKDPAKIAQWARDEAKRAGKDVLIVDTSGRLHVDKELMEELAEVRRSVKPHHVLLVLDSMTGQDAVNVAQEFAETADFDGVILTKLDGDTRGGAALSIAAVTGKPILFAATGEKLDELEQFHPERMAQRILGMGDVMTLIEKAESQFDEDKAKELERKIRRAEFTLEDFLEQLRALRKMGPINSILKMMPGIGKQLKGVNLDERELDRLEAIVLSMTPKERRQPEIIKGSRRRRIANGSGTTVQAVSRLIKQFGEMRKMMKGLSKGKMSGLGALMRDSR